MLKNNAFNVTKINLVKLKEMLIGFVLICFVLERESEGGRGEGKRILNWLYSLQGALVGGFQDPEVMT